MIHLSSGNLDGIGLECLFKSLVFDFSEHSSDLLLHANGKDLMPTLKSLSLKSEVISENEVSIENTRLALKPLPASLLKSYSAPQVSLMQAMKACEADINNHLLATLPISKDQLQSSNKEKSLGHTEYFRSHYNNPLITMLFYHPQLILGLLTDHLPLSKALSLLKTDFIVEKVCFALEHWPKQIKRPRKVLFAGINPHAGEKGLFGQEDEQIQFACEKLAANFPKIEWGGPYPADTVYWEVPKESYERHRCLVYFPFHDFGLPLFKGLFGHEGLNLTFGIPYLRVSVDHGTAPSLFGLNRALYQGCSAMLDFALSHHGSH